MLSIARVLDRNGRYRFAFEPIADLTRGTICGYEALARYPDAITPELWRIEADRRGLEPDLHAFVLGSLLAVREQLPPDCFVSFDVQAPTLLRPRVRERLLQAQRLDGLVVELRPRVQPLADVVLATLARELREAGAEVAVDGIGSGFARLHELLTVRPEVVKLDARLVRGCDRDPTRLAVIGAFVRVASGAGARIVAQGVERIEELDALMRLRVPLAQGPLIGVRAKTPTPVAFALRAYVRERGAAAAPADVLAGLVEQPPALEHDAGAEAHAAVFAAAPQFAQLPLVDAQRRPVGMLDRDALARGEDVVAPALLALPAACLAEVGQRAMLRPPATRFHPIVCCDGRGRYVGVVPLEALVSALASASEPRDG